MKVSIIIFHGLGEGICCPLRLWAWGLRFRLRGTPRPWRPRLRRTALCISRSLSRSLSRAPSLCRCLFLALHVRWVWGYPHPEAVENTPAAHCFLAFSLTISIGLYRSPSVCLSLFLSPRSRGHDASRALRDDAQERRVLLGLVLHPLLLLSQGAECTVSWFGA